MANPRDLAEHAFALLQDALRDSEARASKRPERDAQSAELSSAMQSANAVPIEGTASEGAVTAELLRFCDQVVLNVRSDNPPALAVYRSLGFREHARFEERLARRRGSVWDSISGSFRRFASRRTE